jgi:hypothetical protein
MQPKWQLSIGRFSQIWIQAINMEIEQFKLPSIFFCYLHEPCIEILQVFLNFGQTLAIENIF